MNYDHTMWKFLSKATKVVGGVTCFGIGAVDLYLIDHWRASRPYAPQPALGWTVPLPWCLGAFGTAKEAAFLQSSSDWWFPAGFMMVALGVAIDFYKFGISPTRTVPEVFQLPKGFSLGRSDAYRLGLRVRSILSGGRPKRESKNR
jgi:hypothetical protein